MLKQYENAERNTELQEWKGMGIEWATMNQRKERKAPAPHPHQQERRVQILDPANHRPHSVGNPSAQVKVIKFNLNVHACSICIMESSGEQPTVPTIIDNPNRKMVKVWSENAQRYYYKARDPNYYKEYFHKKQEGNDLPVL